MKPEYNVLCLYISVRYVYNMKTFIVFGLDCGVTHHTVEEEDLNNIPKSRQVPQQSQLLGIPGAMHRLKYRGNKTVI